MTNKKMTISKELKERMRQFMTATAFCSCKNVQEHIEELEQHIPPKDELISVSKIFKALSNVNRVKILYLLETSPRCNCEIEILLGLSQSTISHHIKELQNVALITIEKKGKWSLYNIKNKRIVKLLAEISEITKLDDKNTYDHASNN